MMESPVAPGLLYFAYGCNMDHAFFESVVGRNVKEGWPARVDGWRVAFSKGGEGAMGRDVVANLERDEGCATYGVVYRLPFESLPVLDEFEGVPEHYRRDTLWVEPIGRRARQAAVAYFAQPRWIVGGGKPSDDYLARVIGGARAHGLPGAYVDWLLKLASREVGGGYRADV